LHLLALFMFEISLDSDKNIVEKGDEVRVTVRVRVREKYARLAFLSVILPTAFRIRLDVSQCFTHEADSCVMMLAPREKTHVFVLKSAFWGKASVGIAQIRAVDLLGIFAAVRPDMRLADFENVEQSLSVKIYPAIPLLTAGAEFIRVLEESSVFDDNEQTREVSFATTGFPGYEHRDYFPGDPLKSINWKLSAKRDRLLVRKPEAFAGGSQILLLDALSSQDKNLPAEQLALEAMLALASVLIKREIPCTSYIHMGAWRRVELTTGHDLEQFRLSLCEYTFMSLPPHGRLPADTDSEASGYVVFSAEADIALNGLLEPIRQKDTTLEIVSPIEGYANNWQVKEITGEVVFVRT